MYLSNIACCQSTGACCRYSVQCVLPINMYNEKIFLFLWFWMVFVAAISCINFVTWLIRCAAIFRSRRRPQ